MFRLMKAFARVVLSSCYRIEVQGEERLPRKDAFILLPKHQRWQDIPLVAIAARRPLYFIAKQELFTNRWVGWFLSSLGGIPLNREQPMKSRASIRVMLSLLERGEGVVIFPEGTYYPYRMGPGKSGMLRLILSRLAFPLIPAGIRYRGGGARTHVRISFGEAIWPREDTRGEEMLSRVMKGIAALSGLTLQGEGSEDPRPVSGGRVRHVE